MNVLRFNILMDTTVPTFTLSDGLCGKTISKVWYSIRVFGTVFAYKILTPTLITETFYSNDILYVVCKLFISG